MFGILRKPPPGVMIGKILVPWIACTQGIFAFGQPGAGKSQFLLSLIRQLAGRAAMFITTVRPTDFADVAQIFRQLRMEHKLIRLGIGSPDRLDIGEFLTAKLAGGGPRLLGHALTLAGQVLNNSGSGGGEKFWDQLISDVAYFCTSLCILATGRANLSDIFQIVMTLPSSQEDFASDKFLTDSTCGRMLVKAKERRKPKTDAAYSQVVDFIDRIAGIGSKARTAGVQGAGSVLGGIVAEFGPQTCAGSTIDLTEVEQSRKAVVIDGAPMVHHSSGKAFNFLNAACVQFHCMARPPKGLSVPTFLFRDEAAWILNSSHDAQIQAVSRAQLLASVAAAQNLPIMQAGLGGGDKARMEAQAFAGMHNHKMFFRNTCTETNDWTVKLCGEFKDINLSGGQCGRQGNTGDLVGDVLGAPQFSWSENWRNRIQPERIATLRTGEALLYANGTHRFVDLWEKRRR